MISSEEQSLKVKVVHEHVDERETEEIPGPPEAETKDPKFEARRSNLARTLSKYNGLRMGLRGQAPPWFSSLVVKW